MEHFTESLALMAERRTVEIHARVSPADRAAGSATAAAAGVPLSM